MSSTPVVDRNTAAQPVLSGRLRARCGFALEVLAVVAIIAVCARWPVPDVNEPHYLGKARHFWNPEWAAGDFFLQTADSHQVFFLSLGWLSTFLSLPAFAVVTRLLAWLALAAAWTRLCRRVVPRRGTAVLTMALVALLIDHGQMAGEWLIGGVEAKVFAYATVFAGLAALVRGGWNACWIWFGVASALHVVVGGWAVVAAGAAWGFDPRRPRVAGMLPGLLAGGAISLIGVIPGLLLNRGAAAGIAQQAADLYVYTRLWHHLYFPWFPPLFIAQHVALILLWIGLLTALWSAARRADRTWIRGRRLHGFVAGAVGIAVVGVMISLVADAITYRTGQHPAWSSRVLRLYWFRLTDVMVPVGVALAAAQMMTAGRRLPQAIKRTVLTAAVLLAVAQVGFHLRQNWRAELPGAVRGADPEGFREWLAMCGWVRQNTPPDAVFITPRTSQTFRWYADRGEMVNWKDVPQDAESLVEWWQRHQDQAAALGLEPRFGTREDWPDEAKVRDLASKYQADYLVQYAWPPLELPVVYENSWYVVYRLDP